MSADLREKLEALIRTIYEHGYSRGASDEGVGRDFDPGGRAREYVDTEPYAAQEIMRLLASHEEREGEEPWPEFVSRVLDMAANSDEGPDVTLAEQGHAITRTEEWLRSRLRSHTDREPDGKCVGSTDYDGDGDCLVVRPRPGIMVPQPIGTPIYIGPPVQPEEES